jgi:hypothetical protein
MNEPVDIREPLQATGLMNGSEVALPAALRAREHALLQQRRKSAELPALEEAPPVGVALSGGGIRSATFALGFFQALAAARLLARVDYLSTVSGGGYFGGFLGALFRRKWIAGVDDVASVLLGRKQPRVLRYLRENGRYLAPAGTDDMLFAAAVMLRSWIAIMAVLISALLTMLIGLQLATRLLLSKSGFGLQLHWLDPIDGHVLPLLKLPLQPSPWLVLPVFLLGFAVVPIGWSFWTLDMRKLGVRLPFPKLAATLWTALPHCTVALVGLQLAEKNHPRLGGWLLVTAVLALATAFMASRRSAWALAVPYVALAVGMVGYEKWARFELGEGAIVIASWMAPELALAAFILALAFAVAERPAEPATSELDQDRFERHVVSVALKNVLLAGAGLLALALIDTAARTARPIFDGAGLVGAGGGGVALGAGMGAIARRSALLFAKPSGAPRVTVPFELLAWCAALLVAAVLLVWLDLVAGALTGSFALAHEAGDHAGTHCLIAGGVISVVLGLSRGLLNRSSPHALYASRLTRAYLGASNENRHDTLGEDAQRNPTKLAATRLMPEDDLPAGEYFGWPVEGAAPGTGPHAKGAPLHLVNVTINETVDGRSQIQQLDRKGLGLALGPCGLSAGVRHHAVFSDRAQRAALTVYPEAGWRIFDLPIPIEVSSTSPPEPQRESVLQRAAAWISDRAASRKRAAPRAGLDAKELPRDRLWIGQWLGISGAAVSPGLGSRTHVGLSFLAALANIRLGYWWRHGFPRPALPWRHRLRAVFWVQGYFYREMLARFPGTSNMLWYLSDGGHFENLGGYELIRRRLPFIVIVDAEADPDGRSEGLANLVRKARLDFGAEIEFVEDLGHGPVPLPAYVGALDDLRRGRWRVAAAKPPPWAHGQHDHHHDTELEAADRAGLSRAHAALARVTYADDPNARSWLLYVKPTLVGDEPGDIAHYHAEHPAFPHEPTSDQFFDEAQWESYRKLGELIGSRLWAKGHGALADIFEGRSPDTVARAADVHPPGGGPN